jgi:DNA polymerase III subunit chi
MAPAAVAFHFNVPQRQDYTCRLLRKATRAGARLIVTGDAGVLSELDRLLWTFDSVEFVPHWRGVSIERLPARLQATPVVLLEQPAPKAGYEVLVNLGDEVPAVAQAFARVIEVVGRAEADRTLARQRWRQYTQWGVTIERHEARA